MKLLTESGIQNIRSIAKEYNEAWIYGHIDFDGVISSMAMKFYLQQYGIKVSNWIPIQYGGMEYAVQKPHDGVLPVLVDFAHGKVFFKIHTDHHDSQIQYDNSSRHFSHSKSNASTISSVISPTDIFSKEDMRVVDMVDSAGYASEGVDIEELKNYIYNYTKDRTIIQNHLRFGMIVNKLLLAFKNKKDFLKTIILNSNPSLVSIFNNIIKIIKENNWSDLKTLQKNSEWYADKQKEKIIPNGEVDTIESLSKGESSLIGNTIVQIGGGMMNKSGAYDRYTAFKNHPTAKYFVMIWDSIGMMQVSMNNWNKENRESDIHLGNIVIGDIFTNKYAPLLNEEKYDISLLAIKKTLEENINEENEKDAVGFTYDEFFALFNKTYDLTEKQKKYMVDIMNKKPSQLTPSENDSDKTIESKMKMVNFLNKITIPLPEIILTTSGGHKGITNLNGFSFLNTQERINKSIKNGENPYTIWVKPADYKPNPNKKESTSLRILKDIARDVVERLNS
jgi:hypothetical protein